MAKKVILTREAQKIAVLHGYQLIMAEVYIAGLMNDPALKDKIPAPPNIAGGVALRDAARLFAPELYEKMRVAEPDQLIMRVLEYLTGKKIATLDDAAAIAAKNKGQLKITTGDNKTNS